MGAILLELACILDLVLQALLLFLLEMELLFITLPPKFGHNEYNSYADFNVWDLEKVDLRKFDVDSALNRWVLGQLMRESEGSGSMRRKQAEFRLGLPIHTVCGIESYESQLARYIFA